ncbi:MAG: 50S ribosomal protein L9 [Firmicutes bacterium]|nr:50S ribosomal protein L9 [Bacillota bacterium]
MKVILTQDVKGQGKKGDVVEVSDGYARNFLFKNRFATEATSSQLNVINMQKEAAAHHKAVEKAEAVALAKKIDELEVVLKVKVGTNGKIFGAINTQNIADGMAKKGIAIDKKKIVLKDPIKSSGQYKIVVKTYAEVSGTLSLVVEAE